MYIYEFSCIIIVNLFLYYNNYPSPTHSVCEDIVVTLLVIPSTCIREIIPSTCIRERDIVIAPLVIPSTCIRGRDMVVTLLVIPRLRIAYARI